MLGKFEEIIIDDNSKITCKIKNEEILVSYCSLTINNSKWNICSWYTYSSFYHKGYGKIAMKKLFSYCVNKYGIPTEIQYTWNGQNSYVYDWMVKHFDAKCRCSLAVQKYDCSDNWESHLYDFNVSKFLNYLNIL